MNSPQKVTEIEEKVAELKDRIYTIMEVVVNGVAGKDPKEIPNDLLRDIDQLALSVHATVIYTKLRIPITFSEISAKSSTISMK